MCKMLSCVVAAFSMLIVKAEYLVVDLSAGPNAVSYPITLMETEPEGGWTDTYKTTKLVLQRINPGTCQVDNGIPIVCENPYYIGVFEVTQRQYELVVGKNPSGGAVAWYGEMRPGVCVSYLDIMNEGGFAAALLARTKLSFRLPTEVEWEYACRAGTSTDFNDEDGMAEIGRYKGNWTDGMGGYSECSTKVGSYKPNAWGLYDMHGNVWEWTSTHHDEERMLTCGGNFNFVESDCKASSRCFPEMDTGYGDGGFRIALSGFTSPTIFGVTAQQRYPWNGKVDITYTVFGDIAGYALTNGLITTLKVTASDKVANKTYTATAAALSGATTLTEGNHAIVWDLDQQGMNLKSSNVVFNVSCEASEALFCVIDLSAGPEAESYPVSYIADIPEGGWTDEYKTDKLVLRRCNAGSFKMQGSTTTTLTKPFYMGVFEVTQKQWMLVMGSWPNSSPSSSYGAGDGYPAYRVSYNNIRGSSNGAKWPSSSAVDATSFLGKLQARTKLNFDLPTEAQWEYACRAGTTTTYYWGDSMNGDYAWYSSNSSSQGHPVGTKKPNAWGLYDMSGNVWEWCLDWYNSSLTYGTDPKGATSGSRRVARGGSWYGSSSYCRSYVRNLDTPDTYQGYNNGGFRLSWTLP